MKAPRRKPRPTIYYATSEAELTREYNRLTPEQKAYLSRLGKKHYQIEYPETIEEGGQTGVVDIWAENKQEAEKIAKERMGKRSYEVRRF